jgi:transcriptional regulator with XRE-family HTH domain
LGAPYLAPRTGSIGTEKSVHTPAYRRLVALLVEAREAAGLTQRALAARLRCHPSWVAKVETRKRRLDVVELVRLARALRRDPAALVAEVARHVRR